MITFRSEVLTAGHDTSKVASSTMRGHGKSINQREVVLYEQGGLKH